MGVQLVQRLGGKPVQCVLEKFVREKTGAFPRQSSQRESADVSAAIKANSTCRCCKFSTRSHVEDTEKHKGCSLQAEPFLSHRGDKHRCILETRE